MDIHATEEQQLAAAREWLKQNGSSIVVGLILGFAVLFGIRAWFAWQENQAQQASELFATLIHALDTGDTQTVTDQAGMLIADHADSGYAAMAALAVAKVRIEEGELEAARAQLQWVLDNSNAGYLRDTARLRMARVLMAMNDLDAADQLLRQTDNDPAQAALFAEARGDIYQQRGDQELAARSYREALDGMGDEYPGRQLLLYKLDNARSAVDAGTSQ